MVFMPASPFVGKRLKEEISVDSSDQKYFEDF